MRGHRLCVALAAAATVSCGSGVSSRGDVAGVAAENSLVTQSTQAAIVGMTSALSTPAQRHVVRLQGANGQPVHLMAVQNDGYTYERAGLLWYRSDDGGATWRFYKDMVAQPDPAVFNTSRSPRTLHLTADLVVVGNDVAAVYSFDSTLGSFPADSWDPQRVVLFQWWRFDGSNDWIPGQRVTVATPGSGQAYRRATLARDGAGRLWIQAFLRRSSCSPVGSSSCTGDLVQAWVSTNGGAAFQGPQNLASLPNQLGGGRLISTGTQLLSLWGDYSTAPAQLMKRNDSDPLTQWSAKANAFADGSHVYHGASLSSVPDGSGGVHLVYKKWIADPNSFRLYYRRYDGSTFGSATAIGSVGDWATQPAVTGAGGELYVCVNHLVSTNANYEVRSYRLSSGFSSWDTVDAQVNAKAYPSAPERVPATDGTIPCAFGMGDNGTWGAGHTVQVAQQPGRAAPAAAAAPTFSPAPGTYASAQSVSLSTTTSGATIYFTTNGTTPTTSSARYTGPITVGTTTTIRAFATASGFANSAVSSATYTIGSTTATAAAAPTFSPAPGTYASAQSVSLSSATSGATIYFTVDGTTPTTSSARYTGPITVGTTTTIRAFATASGFTNSAVSSATYTISTAQSGALFADDFTRTTGLGASWRTWYGTYSTDGSAAVSGTAPTQGNWAAVVAPLGTSDYAVSATMSVPAGALYSGIVARSSGSDFTRDLYSAQISATGAVNLYRRNGWTWTLLGSVSAGVQPDRLYLVELVTVGSSPVHVEVWLDGTRVLSHDDASASRLTSGAVGVENYDARVRYDSFRVVAR